jgi:tetratricopeptide (TPR) repeat protein
MPPGGEFLQRWGDRGARGGGESAGERLVGREPGAGVRGLKRWPGGRPSADEGWRGMVRSICVWVVVLAGAAGLVVCAAAGGEGDGAGALVAELEAMPTEYGLPWAVDRRVVTALFEADRSDVLRALEQESEALAVMVARFDVHVRAGHRAEAAELIPRIMGHPDFRRPGYASDLVGLLEARHEFDLAVEVLRGCPTASGSRFVIAHVVETQGEDAADELLEYLAGAGREDWLREWVRFRTKRGTAESILERLRDAVVENPDSIEPAERYVIAARAESKGREVEWIGDACKPKLAVECYELGWEIKQGVASQSYYEAAIKLLKRSLSLELTEEDVRRFSGSMAGPPRVDLGLLLRARTEELLAECYQKTGRADLAKPLVEKLAKLEIDGMSLDMLRLAGQVQAQTGQRVVEGMVVEREEPSADSAEYWLDRAEYFIGRKEEEQVRAAFEKALALCSREVEDRERGAQMRLRVVHRYVWYLRRERAFGDAAALLRSELGQAPAGSELARRVMWLLADMDRERQYRIEPGDELLWSALASMAVWDSAEERVLRCMVANAGREGRDEVIGRGEGLCRGAHPSRAQQLGDVCLHVAPERAVVLLRDAEARLEDEGGRERVSSSLFRVYLELGWVEEAERQFAVALAWWGLEAPEQLARVAQVAAEKGDDGRAMRLWRRVANMDGTYLEPLPKLAESGLGERLRGFYEEWGEWDPESWIPEAALGML